MAQEKANTENGGGFWITRPPKAEAEAAAKLIRVAAKLARNGQGEEAILIREAVDAWALSVGKERAQRASKLLA
jgi:hypothetical protein